MKKFISILFYGSIGILLIGMIFKMQQQHCLVGNMLFTFGLLGLLVYFTARTIKDFLFHRNNKYNILLQILIVFMSGILFSKYLYHYFGDYPGILIIPLFIVSSAFYLFTSITKDNKLITATIAYLLLSIPLFGLEINNAPRPYIPTEWYNRYNVNNPIPINQHSRFKFNETAKLSVIASDLSKSKYYIDAMMIYRKALNIEPKNVDLLSSLSECYAYTNQLERAVSIMDTVISLDNGYAPFYSNRGLMHLKLKENNLSLKDFQKAILLDSTQWVYYANLALLYYIEKDYEKASNAIQKAESLGMGITGKEFLNEIKKRKCE